MDRKEFLEQLERLLYDIPPQEREEALDYYSSYFDEAGEEKESSVIQELGSPGKVAAIIKADLKENEKDSYGEYTEYGYTDERFDNREMPEVKTSERRGKNTEGSYEGPYRNARKYYEDSGQKKRDGYSGQSARNKNGVMWGILIVLAILTSPAWGGVLLGILGMMIGLGAGVFAIIVAILGCAVGLFAGGIGMVIYAIIHLFSTPAVAIAFSGLGMVATAMGILLMLAFLWIACKGFPAAFRFFVDLVQRIFHRGIRGGERL
ncbi:MAG: DUF1700 domain-containing protein [Blautia sp.]